ncbi:hypothetical protein [Nocardia anaemiae]|uniref:hypothetical protein n=1 Tax=Nocardia anaemiae TaxID=263910 RepID=UPI0007A4787E|nr:hypothetical protein [Nocardia anaemiae]
MITLGWVIVFGLPVTVVFAAIVWPEHIPKDRTGRQSGNVSSPKTIRRACTSPTRAGTSDISISLGKVCCIGLDVADRGSALAPPETAILTPDTREGDV